MSGYLDFELEIGQGDGREYPLAVVRSPAGETRAVLRWPYGDLELDNRLLTLQNALLRSGGQRRAVMSPDEAGVQQFGGDLFDLLFAGDVRSLFFESQREASHQGLGLRLKLRINAPELAALPWEFLHDPRSGDYLCLSRNTPVVRYIELARPIPPLAVEPPLRILGMVASPKNLPPLNVAVERQRVERGLARVIGRGAVELTWLEGQTWRDLQRALRQGPWHIFHFVGHGGFDRNTGEGLVMLADDQENAFSLDATQLARLLADHNSLRLAVFNSCEGARGDNRDLFSSTAAVLVRAGIPAVLAMQYEITDAAAMEMSASFYEALADGLPVDEAVCEARKAISLAVANSLEWGTPVLYTRMADGVLFDMVQATVKPPPQGGVAASRVAAEAAAQQPAPSQAGAEPQPEEPAAASTAAATVTMAAVPPAPPQAEAEAPPAEPATASRVAAVAVAAQPTLAQAIAGPPPEVPAAVRSQAAAPTAAPAEPAESAKPKAVPTPQPIQEPARPREKYPRWLGIMIQPRRTIRAILDGNPSQRIVWLVVVAGSVPIALAISIWAQLDMGELLIMLTFTLGSSMVGIVLWLFLGSLIMRAIAEPLGGQATWAEIRLVLAWTYIPICIGFVFALLISAIRLLLGGLPEPTVSLVVPLLVSALGAALIVHVVSLIISISEANHIVVWRSLIIVAIPIALSSLLFGSTGPFSLVFIAIELLSSN